MKNLYKDKNNLFLGKLSVLINNKKFLKESSLVFIYNVQNSIGILIQLKIFSYLLGFNNFGKLTFFNSISTLILTTFSNSIGSAFARLFIIAKKANNQSSAIRSIIQITCLIIFINFLYSLTGIYAFQLYESKYILVFLLFLFTSFKTIQEIFRQIYTIERQRLRLILNDTTYYFAIIFLICLYHLTQVNLNLNNIILIQIAASLASIFYIVSRLDLSYIQIIKEIKASFKEFDSREFKNIINLSIPIGILSLTSWIQNSLSKFFLNQQLLYEDIGKLAILQQVYFGPTIIFVSMILTLIYPILNSNININISGDLNNKDRLYIKNFFKINAIIFLLSFILIVILYNIFNQNILNFFNIEITKENFLLINIILISAFFQGGAQILSAYSLSILKVNFFSKKVAPVTIFFGIPLIYILTSNYGLQGALLAKLIIVIIIFMLNWLNFFKYI